MSDFIFLFRSSDAEAEQALGTQERAQKSLAVWLSWIRELEQKGAEGPRRAAHRRR